MGPDSYSDPGLRYVFGAPSVGSMFVGSTYQSLHMPGIGVYGPILRLRFGTPSLDLESPSRLRALVKKI